MHVNELVKYLDQYIYLMYNIVMTSSEFGNNHERNKLATVLAAAALMIPATAEAATTHSKSEADIRHIEQVVDQRITNYHPIGAVRGALFFRHLGTNPYTHERQINENKITNPLVFDTKVNRLNTNVLRDVRFGYIDIMSSQARTVFMDYDPKTMNFVPVNHHDTAIPVRQVKFDSVPSGGFDYSHPLRLNGSSYSNELFGISTPVNSSPTAKPPGY